MKQINSLVIGLVSLGVTLCVAFLILSLSHWWPIQTTPKLERDDGLNIVEFDGMDSMVMDDAYEEEMLGGNTKW